MTPRARALVVVACAVGATSLSAPLIRLATAPPLAIAAWRIAITLALLAPAFLRADWRREWTLAPPGSVRLAVLGGLAVSLHFAAFITSVRLTTVAAASALTALAPVFTALLSHLVLHERPTRRETTGIAIAVAGAFILASGDAWRGDSRALLGDLLALGSALCGAVYFLVGRRLRAHIGLVSYVVPVYALCGVVLLAWAALRHQAFVAYPARDWALITAMAMFPMIVGHTGLNYALRWLPAYQVNVAGLGEPVLSTLIAWGLPAIAEPPSLAVVAGGAVSLMGIAVTLRASTPPRG